MATTAAPLDMEQRARLLDEWVEVRRRIAALEARASRLLEERIVEHDADVSLSPSHRDAIYRSMIAEYSAAGHLSTGTVECAFADALALSQQFPAIRAAFARGAITSGHVREIVRAGAIVAEAVRNGRADAEVLPLYETSALVVAEADTAARTRAHVRQVVAALVDESVRERHGRANAERCVRVRSLDDGLAMLTAVLPETLAVAIHDRLARMAREVVRARRESRSTPDGTDGSCPVPDEAVYPEDFALDDALHPTNLFGDGSSPAAIFGESGTFTTDPHPPCGDQHADDQHVVDRRTVDQVRADLFTDLLLAANPSDVLGSGLDRVQARIQVTVAASTLAGADDRLAPLAGADDRLAQLDGHGPLDPEVARALAGRQTGWSRLFLDPGGMVTEVDTYTPTEGMRRFLRARDQHCRFPGCRMPVHRCDIDHHHDHALGGRTALDNLSHFCRGHHALKHPDVEAGYRWRARALPNGDVEWTSPLGRAYPDHPSRRVMFV
ncbi:DUF222 domain-containing protein [Microbacterium sp. 179-I 3D4 NHS]|uniref:HNH endonuclease signature motif containing protein n=1 Tax=Microbacterium sp. 179-I 3D4 NHS TaxID=3142381 RepID=UPI0039A250F5